MINFCKLCLMPDTRPRIFFDQDGVCNACLHSKKKDLIDFEWLREVKPKKYPFYRLDTILKKNEKMKMFDFEISI
mgnify:CR=1 FL=1